jgi:predicted aconitase with swiveling domain
MSPPVGNGAEVRGRALTGGHASGSATVLDEPLSFWGGVDPATGRVEDPRHPQFGIELSGRVLVMPSGRGSSSSSTVLAEMVRVGTSPAGIVLQMPDPVLVLGAIVAAELYGRLVPVVALDPEDYSSIETGDVVGIETDDRTALVRLDRPRATRR